MEPKLELLLLDSENSTTHISMDGTKDQDIAREPTEHSSIPRISEEDLLAQVLLTALLNVIMILNAMASSLITTANV